MKIFSLLFVSVLLSNFSVLAQCPTGNVRLNTQQEVNQFVSNYPNCNHINGHLYIDGTDITDLSGLSNITQIDSYLFIGNTHATTINLSKLNTIGGSLSFQINTILEQLNLSSLNAINGYLYFQQNSKLTSLDLSKLTSGVGYVNFSQNTLLTDINMCQLKTINGYLYFYQNSALNSICFDNLEKINAYLYLVESNLDNLTTFRSLTTIGSYLHISNNSNLIDCSGLCNLLNNNGISGSVTFENNPSECSSQTEVEASCTSLAVKEIEDNLFTVYPNPTEGTIYLTHKLQGAKYTISDVMGKILQKSNLRKTTIDISMLKNGIYYLSISKDNHIEVKKIIKRS